MKWIFLVLLAVLAYFAWDKRQSHLQQGESLTPSAHGFIALPESNLGNADVVILSPPHCPSEEAQRGNRLADYLAQHGVPYTRATNINFQLNNQKELEKIRPVMEGAGPVVIVKGKAKANPSPEDVVHEYKGS